MKKILITFSIIVTIGILIYIFYPSTVNSKPNTELLNNTGAMQVTSYVDQMHFEPINKDGDYTIKRDGGVIYYKSKQGLTDIHREIEDLILPKNNSFSWTPDSNSKDTHHIAIIEKQNEKITSYSIYKITKEDDKYFANLIKSVKVNIPMKYKNKTFLKDIVSYLTKEKSVL